MSSRVGKWVGMKWGRRPLKKGRQNMAVRPIFVRLRRGGRPGRPGPTMVAGQASEAARPCPRPCWAGISPFFLSFFYFLFLSRKRPILEMQYLPHTNSVFDNLGLVGIVTTSTTRLCRETSLFNRIW